MAAILSRPPAVLLLLLLLGGGGVDEPFDPWTAVDDLIASGRREAAVALAARVDRFDRAALEHYVRMAPEERADVREALVAAEAALATGDEEKARAALAKVKDPGGGMAGLRFLLLRGRLSGEGDTEDAAAPDLARAGEIAVALGRDPVRELEHLDGLLERLVAREEFRKLEALAGVRLDVAWLTGDVSLVAFEEADLGGAYLELRLPDRALPLLERSRARFDRWSRTLAGEKERAAALGDRAWVDQMLCVAFSARGEYPAALAAGEAALAVLQEAGSPEEVGSALRHLAEVHSIVGAGADGLRLGRRALETLLGAEGAERREILAARLAVGNCLMETGQLEEALVVLGLALGDAEALGSDRATAVTRINLGEAFEKSGDRSGALALYRLALESAAGDPQLTGWVQCRIGDALSGRGTERDPESLAEAARAYRAVKAHDPSLALLVAVGEGEVLLAQGKPEPALGRARDAADRLDDLTGGLADPEAVQARGQEDRRRLFALGIRAARACDQPDALFEMLERSRARAFLAALGGREALLRRVLTRAEAGPALAARERLAIATRALHRAWSNGDLGGIRAAEAEVASARTEYDAVVRSVERGARRLRGFAPAEVPDLRGTIARLGEDEAVVLYSLLDDASLAFVIGREGVRVAALPPAADLRALAAIPPAGTSAADFDEWLARLRGALVKPLGLPPAVLRLHVSPDGPLSALPWPLLAGEGRSAVLVPSAALVGRPGSERAGKGIVALGDPVYVDRSGDGSFQVYANRAPLPPLPSTRREVEAITGPGDLRLLGEEATEPALASALRTRERLSVLHLACHGILHPRDPRFSALALTPGGGQDGFLTALEIYLTEVRADLVVLSACESARDPATTGEGVAGLVRSFLLAGADRVLASLWPVDDEATRELMVRFHAEWARGDIGVVGALRRAQREVARSRPNPRDWAGWVIWGVAE